MPSVPVIPYFNSTNPPAPAGYQNAKPKDAGTTPIDPLTFGVPNTGGGAVKTANYTLQASDCGLILPYNSTTAGTYTLPNPVPFLQWAVIVTCIGTGALTVSPNSLQIDGSSTSLTLNEGQSALIQTDGTNYFTAKGGGGGGGGGGGISIGGDIGGTPTTPLVIGLQGNPVANTPPTNGQVLTWNTVAGDWQPAAATGGLEVMEVPAGTQDGTNPNFTTSFTPVSPVKAYRNGVEQDQPRWCTVTGNLLTFVKPPHPTDQIYVVYSH